MPMETSIMACGPITLLMDLDFISMRVGLGIKGSGRMINRMAGALRCTQMEESTLESMLLASNMGRVLLDGLMDHHIPGASRKTKLTVMGNTYGLMLENM